MTFVNASIFVGIRSQAIDVGFQRLKKHTKKNATALPIWQKELFFR